MSIEETLYLERKQDIEQVLSEIDIQYESSRSFNEMEDLDENIYFIRKLVSSFEEIEKLKVINKKLEAENIILKD